MYMYLFQSRVYTCIKIYTYFHDVSFELLLCSNTVYTQCTCTCDKAQCKCTYTCTLNMYMYL